MIPLPLTGFFFNFLSWTFIFSDFSLLSPPIISFSLLFIAFFFPATVRLLKLTTKSVNSIFLTQPVRKNMCVSCFAFDLHQLTECISFRWGTIITASEKGFWSSTPLPWGILLSPWIGSTTISFKSKGLMMYDEVLNRIPLYFPFPFLFILLHFLMMEYIFFHSWKLGPHHSRREQMRFSWWPRSSCWWRQSACTEMERPWFWDFCQNACQCRRGVHRTSSNRVQVQNGRQQGWPSPQLVQSLLRFVLKRKFLRHYVFVFFMIFSLEIRRFPLVCHFAFLKLFQNDLHVYFPINHFAFLYRLFLNRIKANVKANVTAMIPKNKSNRM